MMSAVASAIFAMMILIETFPYKQYYDSTLVLQKVWCNNVNLRACLTHNCMTCKECLDIFSAV